MDTYSYPHNNDPTKKKNYEYLSLSTKTQGIMYDEKRKICQLTGKERKKVYEI